MPKSHRPPAQMKIVIALGTMCQLFDLFSEVFCRPVYACHSRQGKAATLVREFAGELASSPLWLSLMWVKSDTLTSL